MGDGKKLQQNLNRHAKDGLPNIYKLLDMACGFDVRKTSWIRGKFRGFLRKGRTTVEHNRNRSKGALLRGSTQYSVETSPDPISPCRSCAFMCFHVSPHSMGLLLLWWTTHSQCKAAMQIICCFLVKVKHIAFCFVLVTLVLFFIRW